MFGDLTALQILEDLVGRQDTTKKAARHGQSADPVMSMGDCKACVLGIVKECRFRLQRGEAAPPAAHGQMDVRCSKRRCIRRVGYERIDE